MQGGPNGVNSLPEGFHSRPQTGELQERLPRTRIMRGSEVGEGTGGMAGQGSRLRGVYPCSTNRQRVSAGPPPAARIHPTTPTIYVLQFAKTASRSARAGQRLHRTMATLIGQFGQYEISRQSKISAERLTAAVRVQTSRG